MNRIGTLFFVFLFLIGQRLQAQSADSASVLSYDTYMQWVYEYHPIAQQIRLLRERAEQQLVYARGGFDPQLGTLWDYKTFDTKNYYSHLYSYFKVPTWIGATVEAGYAHNAGIYLNPEDKLPPSGQAFLGFSLPLLQGLVVNERRTLVQQARLGRSQNEAEIRAQLNDLLLDAAMAYWDWVQSDNEARILQRYLAQAQTRFEAIRTGFQVGDRPAIDTLEAYLRVQDRRLAWNEALLRLQKARLYASNFLWDANQMPLQIINTANPESPEIWDIADIPETQLSNWLSAVPSAHPAVLGYDFQLKQLGLEMRLKRNKILPKLEFKYNFLANQHVDFFTQSAFLENYKFGLKFSMPLLLRQERASVGLTDIKIRETQFKRSQKLLELSNKIRASFAEVNTMTELIAQVQSMVDNYQALLDAEMEKFSIGESSVFLINAREDKVVEAQLKRLSIRIKYMRARTGLQWALALLDDN